MRESVERNKTGIGFLLVLLVFLTYSILNSTDSAQSQVNSESTVNQEVQLLNGDIEHISDVNMITAPQVDEEQYNLEPEHADNRNNPNPIGRDIRDSDPVSATNHPTTDPVDQNIGRYDPAITHKDLHDPAQDKLN